MNLSSTHSSAYAWLMLAGILSSVVLWWRLVRRDDRLVLVYIAALTGAFLGAKLVYLAAEGWLYWNDPNRWVILATGKTITGALLGGYAGVELAKRVVHYTRPTGDWFAVVAPIGIMIGRVGCMIHGCCLGKACRVGWIALRDSEGVLRWPASQTEFVFNALMLAAALLLRHVRALPGQHFHIYLMAYGVFRFFHEFLRDTPAILGPFSGYQIAAAALFALGAGGFIRRRSQTLLVNTITP